jgi:hypothetical protein
MWKMKTVFVTDVQLEHGNWSAMLFDNADEAWSWWNASTTKSVHVREQTLTDPDGNVLASRTVANNG